MLPEKSVLCKKSITRLIPVEEQQESKRERVFNPVSDLSSTTISVWQVPDFHVR